MPSANVEQEGPPQREQGDSKILATPAKQRWTDIAFPARQSDHTVRKRPERREYKIEESLGLGNVGLGKQHDLRPRAIAVAFNSLDEAVRVPIDAVGASLSRRPRGAMARSSHVIALPWYHRRDYTALLMMVSDPQNLPATYDAWLERAEATERQFHKADFDVVRVWIRPDPFAAWCQERSLLPGQLARMTFANEAARDQPLQP
jgi:hypothetical protein